MFENENRPIDNQIEKCAPEDCSTCSSDCGSRINLDDRIIEITTDDDEKIKCLIMLKYQMEYQKKTGDYIAVMPLKNNPEADIFLFRMVNNRKDLENIEDEDEYAMAAEAFGMEMDRRDREKENQTKSQIEELKKKGISFEPGLTDEEVETIQKKYGICFPESLLCFLKEGLPVSDRFYNWRDFSDENVRKIRRRIDFPIRSVCKDVEMDEIWLSSWGNRPADDEEAACLAEKQLKQATVLIPLYGHRFVPCLDGVENPPVLSVYGGDIIYYGENLHHWLEIEFFGKSRDSIRRETLPVIPGWQELIG